MLLLFFYNAYHGSHRLVYNASCVRDPEPSFCLYTAFFFSQYVCSVCFPDKCWPDIFRSEWTDRTYSMQVDTVPHRGFYVIKLHALKAFFSAPPGDQREKPWQFFLDRLQIVGSQITEGTWTSFCQSPLVNGAIVLLVVAFILPCSKFGRNPCQVLCTGGIVVW
jgi:hypothetical protein